MRHLSLILALAVGLSGALADNAVAKTHGAKPPICKDAKGKITKCPATPASSTKPVSSTPPASPVKPASASKPMDAMSGMPGMAPPKPAPKSSTPPAASSAAGHCKDANGKFIKCGPVPAPHKKGVHCRDANGKFIKCPV